MKEYFLPVSILAAAVLISGTLVYTTGVKSPSGSAGSLNDNSVQEPKVLLNLSVNDAVLGNAKAPVTIVEYSDFQCPFCGRFYTQTASQLIETYVKTGKAKFVYRNFPFLGEESVNAAQATECSKDQGKFWEYHNAIFNAEIKDGQEHNGNLNRSLFLSLAAAVGLDSAKFQACLDTNKYADVVDKEYSDAQQLGVQATPTFFVNGTKLEGAYPFAQFKTVIDNELAKVK